LLARGELARGQERSVAESTSRVREAEDKCRRAEMERDEYKRKFADMGEYKEGSD
jgi:hypothetical protein